jgi:hypothetical protein
VADTRNVSGCLFAKGLCVSSRAAGATSSWLCFSRLDVSIGGLAEDAMQQRDVKCFEVWSGLRGFDAAVQD